VGSSSPRNDRADEVGACGRSYEGGRGPGARSEEASGQIGPDRMHPVQSGSHALGEEADVEAVLSRALVLSGFLLRQEVEEKGSQAALGEAARDISISQALSIRAATMGEEDDPPGTRRCQELRLQVATVDRNLY